jgi:hypothetical protein
MPDGIGKPCQIGTTQPLLGRAGEYVDAEVFRTQRLYHTPRPIRRIIIHDQHVKFRVHDGNLPGKSLNIFPLVICGYDDERLYSSTKPIPMPKPSLS